MTSTGATAAYRGYRKQILYLLYEILCSSTQNLIFRPEYHEDITVLKSPQEIVEVIQVKAYSEALSLSDFSPQKQDSFFRRALKIIQEAPQATIRIVSFGSIGPEMINAWAEDNNAYKSVLNKFIGWGYSQSEVDTLLKAIQLTPVDESKIEERVFSFLNEVIETF